MSNTPHHANAAIIAANLVALRLRLRRALHVATAAVAAMTEGNQNRAIGTILECERILPECDALFRTILLMHRSRDSFKQNEVHS
jgi:hypothetical protein